MTKEKLVSKALENIANSEYQRSLFQEIVNMRHTMQGLASFVQNDFKLMLTDGTTTKDGIAEGIIEMDKSFDKTIEKLNALRAKCKNLMTLYSI